MNEIVAVNTTPEMSLEVETAKALIAMSRLLANAPKRDAELVQLWAAVLREAGLRAEEIVPAATRLIADPTRDGADFFPTPAVLIRYARPTVDQDAASELAWQRVKTAITKHGGNASLIAADLGGDGAALWALDRVGWTGLCEELNVENHAIKRADFVRVYKLAHSRGESLDYLPGRFALQNGASNWRMTPAMCGRPDWTELPRGADQPAEVDDFKPLKNGAFQALTEKVRQHESGERHAESRELALAQSR